MSFPIVVKLELIADSQIVLSATSVLYPSIQSVIEVESEEAYIELIGWKGFVASSDKRIDECSKQHLETLPAELERTFRES